MEEATLGDSEVVSPEPEPRSGHEPGSVDHVEDLENAWLFSGGTRTYAGFPEARAQRKRPDYKMRIAQGTS